MNVVFKDGYNLIGRVGGARVKWHNGRNTKWSSPIFVILQFQNKGIASAVRERLFEVYSSDTIDGG